MLSPEEPEDMDRKSKVKERFQENPKSNEWDHKLFKVEHQVVFTYTTFFWELQ
jgi:hypothetical protein